MSEGLNRVMLIGNLGMDPELRGEGDRAVLRLRMATTERYKTRDGERKESTEWHTAVFFGKRAEGLSRYLNKGERVYVEGRLQTREWEEDGNKRYTTEVVGTQLLFLGGKRDGGQRGERRDSSGTRGEQRKSAAQDLPADDFGDDEIPF